MKVRGETTKRREEKEGARRRGAIDSGCTRLVRGIVLIRKRTPVLRGGTAPGTIQRECSGDEGVRGSRRKRKRKRGRERAREREREMGRGRAGKWRLGGHPTPNRRRRHRKARHRPYLSSVLASARSVIVPSNARAFQIQVTFPS